MLFKKPHTVIIKHLKFSNLIQTYYFFDANELLQFVEEYYTIDNFKLFVNINPKTISLQLLESIYNTNPYLENVDLSTKLITTPYEFLGKFNINEYEKTLNIEENSWTEEQPHFIVLNSDEEEGKTLEFFEFEEFFKNLRKIKAAGIVHHYALNEIKVSLDEYVKVLNLYGKFKCDKNISSAKELNQWINDGRILFEVEKKEYVKFEKNEEVD
jgi:hypothetical protein